VADARLNAPNLVSAFRIACVPALLWLAAGGAMNAVLVLFGLALASDAVDGALARRLGQETAFGARLDQWADFALWAALPLAAWWLWPEILRRAYLKYRAVPGYHTWSVKLGALAMALAIPLLLLFDIAWPFRIAALFQLVCAVDELGITLLSAECRHDVPSLLHALRLRRQSRA